MGKDVNKQHTWIEEKDSLQTSQLNWFSAQGFKTCRHLTRDPVHQMANFRVSNLVEIYHSLAIVLVPNWDLGKPAAFDLSVTSTLHPSVLLEGA